MKDNDEKFLFLPLGGLGEIGMNAALYGFGRAGKRQWIMIDCGLSFAGPESPGIDLYFPEMAFVDKIRRDLLGIVITHAHEDHIGAIADLYSRLRCPVYATPFAIGLLRSKRLAEAGALQVDLREVSLQARFSLGPFDLEYINVAHSIPESSALAIGTALGTVIHTGDWKIDQTPFLGAKTDEARLRQLGEQGVLALVCDSTNIVRQGVSSSESDVAKTLSELIFEARGRVLVTTFASNIARIRAVAEAAQQAGRKVMIAGRALERSITVARECGYLENNVGFISSAQYRHFPREKVVLLVTGSQGEPRAALARISSKDHHEISLSPGDCAIFSSRPIPGNEKAIASVINGLVDQGVEIITDQSALVHVSGHPRRGEVSQMYEWTRPQIAIPAHGEPYHLAEHAKFAQSCGVKRVIKGRDGMVVQLAPGEAGIIDEVTHGKLAKDGDIIIASNDPAIVQRRKLSICGVISVALAVDRKGKMVGVPDVVLAGLPRKTKSGEPFDEAVDTCLFTTFDQMPIRKRCDSDSLCRTLEQAIRQSVFQLWGKKPIVHILIIEVP